MPEFPSTHWSFVTALQQADSIAQHRLLESFLRRYMPVFERHVNARFHGVSSHQREDIVQGFVADRIVGGQILQHASSSRGRLRSFLRVCLNNYALCTLRAEKLQAMVGLEEADLLPSNLSPRACTFDMAWVDRVLVETVIAFKDKCYAEDRQELWDVFDLRVARPALLSTDTDPYEALADKLGITTHQARNLLVTAKRICRQIIRDVIGEYATSVDEIDEEIEDLKRIASAAGLDSELSHML